MKAMSAIETCRTAAPSASDPGPRRALRGLRARTRRLQLLPQPPLPEVSGRGGDQWLAEREAELLPVPYYHVVFTLPAAIGAIAFHNKAAVYDLLFRTAAEFIRRFLLHVLPTGFHRIRNCARKTAACTESMR